MPVGITETTETINVDMLSPETQDADAQEVLAIPSFPALKPSDIQVRKPRSSK